MRLVDLVIAGLRRRKGRMILVVLGLTIGVGTVVALHSLAAGLQQEIGAQLDQYGANIVVVPKASSQEVSYGGIAVSAATFDVQPLSDRDVKLLKTIPYRNRLSIVAPKLLGTLQVEGKAVLISGVDFGAELKMKKWWQVSGHVPTRANEVLLGFESAKTLGVIRDPGMTPTTPDHAHHHAHNLPLSILRPQLSIGGSDFLVAGVLQETGAQDDRFIYTGTAMAQQLLHKPDALSLIEVSALCNACPIDDIVAQIGGVLPGAKVSAVQQAVRGRQQTVDSLARFAAVLTLVMFFIGFLMVFITMMASVVERTREIGVLRALGFRKAHIVKIFMIEAAIVSLAGGLIGWVAGTVSGIVSARHFAETGFGAPSLTLGAASLAAALLVGVSSSLYPAIKASRLDPTESLRYF
jgi:putative ABC transport system permease protein